MFLLNGRMKGDYSIPMITCKHFSTVGYFVSSSFVLENVVHFKVDELCKLYSDVHSELYAILKPKISVHDNHVYDK